MLENYGSPILKSLKRDIAKVPESSVSDTEEVPGTPSQEGKKKC